MSTETAKEVLAAWETSSQYWTKHQSLIATMFAPLTHALVEAAHIVPGQSVLDIGGGSGEPSLTIAPIVGHSGSVTYTDPSAGMVKAARDEAARRGLTNIGFHQCSADRLPFPDNAFDGAVSRLSAMFFPDPAAGLREILRVIKPGANPSFVVWANKDVNPFFRIMTDILETFIPVEAEDEDVPAAFRFATPGKLARLLSDAGATSVTERTLKFKIEAPVTLPRFWELRTEMSDTFRSKLAQLEEDQVAMIRDAVQQAVAIYFEEGTMSFPAQALVVSGEKY
jgi:ubiquinone/menaquinone biosynthesis C-methylase UbiE